MGKEKALNKIEYAQKGGIGMRMNL